MKLNQKTFAIMGMTFSILIAIMGIMVFAGAFGGNTSTASGSYAYDSGYAEFGADFYTYVSNNAAEAASASRTAANNIDDLCRLLKNVCGTVLTGFGLLGLCGFGIAFCGCKEEKKAEEPDAVESEAAAQSAEIENAVEVTAAEAEAEI